MAIPAIPPPMMTILSDARASLLKQLISTMDFAAQSVIKSA
jgi:hypothetical protein